MKHIVAVFKAPGDFIISCPIKGKNKITFLNIFLSAQL